LYPVVNRFEGTEILAQMLRDMEDAIILSSPLPEEEVEALAEEFLTGRMLRDTCAFTAAVHAGRSPGRAHMLERRIDKGMPGSEFRTSRRERVTVEQRRIELKTQRIKEKQCNTRDIRRVMQTGASSSWA
jgi:hypothetical protein